MLIKRSRQYLQGIAGLLLAVLFAVPASYAGNVGVIYPEIREPYRQVFVSIADGVAEEAGAGVVTLETDRDTVGADLGAWLERHQIDRLVALGNSGAALANKLTGDRPAIVLGAAVIDPATTSFSGITLNPAPELLFQQALEMRPALEKIHVVFEPQYNQWVIDDAAERARALGLELVAHPVSGMREAARTYRQVQNTMDADIGALWLPMGGPSRDKALLQTLLETAWSRKQMIFSSSLSDVRRGVLFALYPDNKAMGSALAAMLNEPQQKPDAPARVLFVETLAQAVNVRTADHLGLRFRQHELEAFEFIYPPP